MSNEIEISANWDRDSDTLYINKGVPCAAVGEIDDAGLILRFSMDKDEPCGVTVVSFTDWVDEPDDVIRRATAFLSASEDIIRKVIIKSIGAEEA